MKIHGNLDFLGIGSLLQAGFGVETNFPADPQPGRTVFKDSVLYFCTEILGGLPVWVPLTQTLTMLRWTQSVAALEWTIEHNLNTNAVFVQVYDGDGKWIMPDSILTNELNQVTVAFNTPMVGTVIIMRGQTEGAPQPLTAFEQSFTNSDTWVVNHQLGYNPIIRVIVGTNEVQPESIVFNSTMQATITFSTPQTGSVRCV